MEKRREWEEGDLLRAAMWCLKQEAGETTEEALFQRHNEGNATMGVMPRACLHLAVHAGLKQAHSSRSTPEKKGRGGYDLHTQNREKGAENAVWRDSFD